MNLPNQHFREFPIEFKEIKPSDFPNCIIENNDEKIIISPDERGYITNELISCIEKTAKNTVVVNAAVGQGKTTAIIRILKSFYDDTDEDYLIIVASPFVSLVEQYFNEIVKVGVSEQEIYRYEYIGEQPDINYLNKKIHIITVNGILGNPGEDAFINSEAKRSYLNSLTSYCNTQGKKVMLIMDEVHDAIHNFKQEYIFNLWKWKNVLHKNIILSATYNEASKIVIEYLAELTDNKIKIIESERKVIPENQSDLYLHYNPARYYKNTNEQIMTVVDSAITRGKEVDILCYSKNLAESIVRDKDEGVSSILYSKYEEINECTSVLINNNRIGRLEIEDNETIKNRFSNSKCNVGTNFKTGISITKRNHAFIIILPPEGSKLPFSSASGIFSDGINSVIQALARQRKKGGEIHLILPPPDKFNYNSLPFEGIQKEKFERFYDEVCSKKDVTRKVKYIPYNHQKEIVKRFYENTLIQNISREIDEVNNTNRVNRLSLNVPDFSTYLLTKGEQYLAKTYKFFGKDLAAYITYCAITNQFINCSFKGYTSTPPLGFKIGEFQFAFDFFFNSCYLTEDSYMVYTSGNDMYRYLEFKNDLFNNYKLFILKDDNSRVNINKDNSREFESQLLGFYHRTFYPSFQLNYLNDGQLYDYDYTRGDYFISAIAQAETYNGEAIAQDNDIGKRIRAFKTLNHFRRKLIASIQTSSSASRGEFNYILNKPDSEFVSTNEQERFNEMIDYFVNDDYFTSSNIFEFKQRFKPEFSLTKQVNSFYTKLIEDFFIVEDYKLTSGRRNNVKLITSMQIIPNPKDTIDLVSQADYHFSNEFWEANTYNVIDGKLVKNNMS